MLEVESIKLFALSLFIVAVIFFFAKNDEIPLLICIFFFATGINRYDAVMTGKTNWVKVNYAINIFQLSDEKALIALNYFFLGTTLFCLSYIFFSYVLRKKQKKDMPEFFDNFFQRQRTRILLLFGAFTMLNSLFSAMISGTLSFGNSYFYLFQMGIGGIIILAFLLFQAINLNQSVLSKIVFGALIAYSISVSYNPYLRFQFLSWLIAVVIMIFGPMPAFKKIRFYIFGIIFAVILFSMAGVARTKRLEYLTWEERIQLAWERTKSTEDQNMLDGFMMVLDVYPHYLDYRMGMEHFEIFLRPIPRKLWPNKPVGGYHNKLGLNDYKNKGTVGISQTIYGTFYGEGGVMGIIFLSIIYGWAFVRFIRYADTYNSRMRWLIRAIVIASLVPILRGGDLPGIVAFIGMSYWPVFIYLILYNKALKKMALNISHG